MLALRRDQGSTKEHYHVAHALAEELGMRPLVAHCHLGLGKWYADNDSQQAEAHLNKSLSLYDSMDMQYWPELARATLRALQ